ncbi:MAG TPA: ThiF family adenylyltransferase [Terriglobales bacterium]|jgi:molybdopterin/thiamine biosynthesis adenylyltransferase|nr:ThiF family adenylyltransferase [Terriglobales bacterium]
MTPKIEPSPFQDRYSRQALFAPIGPEGQKRIRQSKVALVGCGAIGASTCTLLARAGVGTLRIIDRDYVEPSNLQRQVLFDEEDARQSFPKAEAAARKIAGINSEVAVEPHVKDLTPQTIHLLEQADLILDCTDNFETRYLINDFAVKNGVPWIYAAAVGSYAVTMNVVHGETACLACMFPKPPSGTFATCETAGILNSAANLVASLQVTEALKLMVGAREALRRSLLSLDLWSNERSEISAAQPRPDCSVCAERKFEYLEGKARPQITLCGRNSVQIHERERPVDFNEMSSRLSPHGQVRYNEMVLKFWRETYEMTLFRDGRAIIKGTTDPMVARSLYAKFVGT